MAAILRRGAGSPAAGGNGTYSGASTISAYAAAAAWAGANGIVRPTSGGVFSPKTNAARAQAADALMNYDRHANPAIANSAADMERYDVIFLGYPSWNNDAPRIIYTFLESENLSGKTTVPFCIPRNTMADGVNSLGLDAELFRFCEISNAVLKERERPAQPFH